VRSKINMAFMFFDKSRPCPSQGTRRWCVQLVIIVCLFFSSRCQAVTDDNNNNESPKRERTKIISLAESISKTQKSLQDPTVEEIRKQYWQKALADIRNMSLGFSTGRTGGSSGSNRNPLGHQWKLGVERNPIVMGINETSTDATFDDRSIRRRFEGFMSWENMLQEWADDVQEYLDQVERESSGQDYALGNFGRAPKATNTNATTEGKKQEIEPIDVTGISSNISMVVKEQPDETVEGTSPALKEEPITSTTIGESRGDSAKTPPLPIPAPAQPGEEVLPHTDLSDLSKRVEIVTTAALPWRTGTAVNPLLRAAYLTHGRVEAGGSVTLMLPWLERKGDQEKVYGKSQTFDSPSDQEAYIRDWLRDTANMPEAANDLRIRWYTAWQNPAENSIYSMGDITALIPPDEADICILEEPEHLNWYRAPGESWTKRFKHVVGILHTSESTRFNVTQFLKTSSSFRPSSLQTISLMPWTSPPPLFVLLQCGCCVLGCAVLIAIESLNFRGHLIRWHPKRSSLKMFMVYAELLSILEQNCETN